MVLPQRGNQGRAIDRWSDGHRRDGGEPGESHDGIVLSGEPGGWMLEASGVRSVHRCDFPEARSPELPTLRWLW